MKKKKIILILVIVLCLILGAVCCMYTIDLKRMKDNQEVLFSTWGKDYTPIVEQEIDTHISDVPEEPAVPEYKDENTVKLGLYIRNGTTLNLITDDYTCDWSPENVLGVFYAVPTQEASIPFNNFDTTWKNYINEYPNADKIRIGYSIEFTLKDGTEVFYKLCNPDDAYLTFPKIMSYLYDDVNLVPGKKYYHITQDDMYDYTICSSLKLVGDVESNTIASDIKLTAYSFDSEDDFDENGRYRGNSSYTITIK